MTTEDELEAIIDALLPELARQAGLDPKTLVRPRLEIVDNRYRHADVLIAPFPKLPFFGTPKPTITVNRALLAKDSDELRVILAHELRHPLDKPSVSAVRSAMATTATLGLAVSTDQTIIQGLLLSGMPVRSVAEWALAMGGTTLACILARDVARTASSVHAETSTDIHSNKIVNDPEAVQRFHMTQVNRKSKELRASLSGSSGLTALRQWTMFQLQRARRNPLLLRFLSTHPSPAQRIANAYAEREASPEEVTSTAERLNIAGRDAKPSSIKGMRRRQIAATVALATAFLGNEVLGVVAVEAADAPDHAPTSTTSDLREPSPTATAIEDDGIGIGG